LQLAKPRRERMSNLTAADIFIIVTGCEAGERRRCGDWL